MGHISVWSVGRSHSPISKLLDLTFNGFAQKVVVIGIVEKAEGIGVNEQRIIDAPDLKRKWKPEKSIENHAFRRIVPTIRDELRNFFR